MFRIGLIVAMFVGATRAQSSLAYLNLGESVRPCCVVQDAQGNIYVAAAIRRPGPPASLTTVVAKVDRFLRPVYQFRYDPPGGNFPNAIAVDPQGNVFVAGWSDAPGFPLVNPISNAWHTPQTGFISKLDPSGATLLFSTYLGTNVTGLALDTAGVVYATGIAQPSELTAAPSGYRGPDPVTPSATRLFIAKLTNSGDRLLYSAILGNATSNAIAVGADGSATAVGVTYDASYPTTAGAVQTACGCAGHRQVGNGIISRVSPDGNTLHGYLPWGFCRRPDELNHVVLAANGDAIVAGTATSADFPVTSGSLQASHAGNSDFVVARLHGPDPD